MIEDLKTIESNSAIFVTDEQAVDAIGSEEMVISRARLFTHDDGELLILDSDDYCLVAHNYQGDDKHFIYQLVDHGDINDLEENGYKFLNDDDDFRHKIVIRDDKKPMVYHHSDVGALYSLNQESDDSGKDSPLDASFCEFESGSSSSNFSHIFILRLDDEAFIYQGFEIAEEDISLEESE